MFPSELSRPKERTSGHVAVSDTETDVETSDLVGCEVRVCGLILLIPQRQIRV